MYGDIIYYRQRAYSANLLHFTPVYMKKKMYGVYNSPQMSVAVYKVQGTFLAQSSREISQTVCIICHSFLSRVRISVRPSKFFIGENPQKRAKKSSVQLIASDTSKQ